MVVSIPLSKRGKKNAGKYVALVDDCDADLVRENWTANSSPTSHTMYAYRKIGERKKSKSRFMHRVVLERALGRLLEDYETVDHVDTDGLNNRRENLRLATQANQLMNMPVSSRNKSGYKGVCWHKAMKKWHAQIQHNGKQASLGFFDTPEEAHEVYKMKARELFGEFARFE